MNPKIAEKINEIKNDRLHGAGWMSREAINTLNLAVIESGAETVDVFVDEMKMVAAEIMAARPSMISIPNYISRLMHDIILSSQCQQQLGSLKNFAQTRANELITFSRQAAAKAAEYGAEIIGDKDTVMTCSYSSTVCQTFEIAKNKGIQFRVIIAESQYKGKFYGKISAGQISRHRIPVTVVHDKDIHHHVAEATEALVGADTVLSDGSVINGTPTYRLARAASRANIPFYSVCETVKFDTRNRQDKQPGPEPGFVKTPSDMITGIITEAGILKPDQVKLYGRDITFPGSR